MRRNLTLSLLVGFAAAGLSAESSAPSWGTSAESLLSISAMAFEPAVNSTDYTLNGQGSRWITVGSASWLAPVALPTGALVTGIQLQACDGSAAGQMTAALYRAGTAGGAEEFAIVGQILQTTLAAVPNCDQFSLTFLFPVAIDNSTAMYTVRVQQVGETDGTQRFAGVRIRYKLQVSPSPAVARFTDVPTDHPFFQFVEALAASGITSGCDVSLFCPDAPITRGQMAVFLAAALGLHFPN